VGEKRELNADAEGALKGAIADFKKTFLASV